MTTDDASTAAGHKQPEARRAAALALVKKADKHLSRGGGRRKAKAPNARAVAAAATRVTAATAPTALNGQGRGVEVV